VIIEPRDDIAIDVGNTGQLLLIDNIIKSEAGAVAPIVKHGASGQTQTFAIGNTFTVSNPFSIAPGGRFINIDNQTVPRESLNLTVPPFVGFSPKVTRPVLEPSAKTSVAIQAKINEADDMCNQKPVVHLPYGNYTVTETLTVPANCPIQIIGDGNVTEPLDTVGRGGTRLEWTGGAGPVIKLIGPSKAVLKNFGINGANRANGVEVTNADQAGGRVYIREALLGGSSQHNVLVDRLDRALVELHDFVGHYNVANRGLTLKVVGGPSAAADNFLGGRTNIFSAGTAQSRIHYELTNGGRLLVLDNWHEGQGDPGREDDLIRLTGKGRFTLMTGHYNIYRDGDLIDISNFEGKATLLNAAIWDKILINGSGNGKVFVSGMLGHGPNPYMLDYFLDNSLTIKGVFLNNQRFEDPGAQHAFPVPDEFEPYDANFIREMLEQARDEQPSPQEDLPDDVTDVRIFSLGGDTCPNAIWVKPDA
jgi:hypothetical protein